MKHSNKIAREILSEEYADYHRNTWHYDREYKMIVKAMNIAFKSAIEQAKNIKE